MTLSASDILNLLPVIILAAGLLLTMLLIAVKRNHVLIFSSTLATLAASFAAILAGHHDEPYAMGELFLFDRFAFYYQGLILLSAVVVSIFSFISIQNLFREKRKEEYYVILMLAALGASMIVSCTHFISFFVSLEVLTISLYSLISYYRQESKAIEAGLKYLMMAAMSSAFLLFGIALVFAATGALGFSGLAEMAPSLTPASTLMLEAGAGMIIVGVGFKLGLAPFHTWTPDVYQGASSPASAFIATISKGAVLAALLRIFVMANLYRFETIMMVFTLMAVLSMLAGNILALRQRNIKRMLAYSSIAHFGYVLIAVVAGGEMGMHAATFYVTVYVVATLIAFGVITVSSDSDAEASDITKYRSLVWRKPLLATLFAIALLSLAGIPLTAGFMSKFILLRAGVADAKWVLALTLVAGSVIGLFYYLRVIVVMMKQDDEALSVGGIRSGPSLAGIALLFILGILIICWGIHPDWITDLVGKLQVSSI